MKKDARVLRIIFGTLLGILGIALLISMAHWAAVMISSRPNPYEIDLTFFSGRVLSREKINPGTFTIRVPFEETSQWGKEGILTFTPGFQVISLKAWRPDPDTMGIFQYAETTICPWANSWYKIGSINLEDKTLHLMPGFDRSNLFPFTIIIVFGTCAVITAGFLLASGLCRNKDSKTSS